MVIFLFVLMCLISLVNGSNVVENLIKSTGYPYEKHIVTTEDNYVLELERIPYGLKNSTRENRPPILLVHGLGGASTDFMLLGKDNALTFLLAENGYDVWVLNSRGTIYTTHKTLDPNESKFWDFSWHEIGYYDLPAVIDYILNLTNYNQLSYIGHSQGNTAFFVLVSEKPEYNDKIKAQISYAPAVFLCHVGNPTLKAAGGLEQQGILTNLRKTIGDFNLAPSLPVLKNLCRYEMPTYPLCVLILDLLVNISPERLPKGNFLSNVLQYLPAGASSKQPIHYAQGISKCQFRHYRSSLDITPPEYNLTNVRVPIYAFSGSRDLLQSTKDTLLLQQKLPNGFKELHVLKGVAHTDFVVARDSPRLIYDKTIEILRKLHGN